MHKYTLLALLCVVALFSGCKGKARPDGMPELVNVVVVVTQDGAPLADAALNLISSDGSCKWSVGGKSDESGRATLYTQGDFKGAPEGTFKVGVIKMDYTVKEGATDDEGNPLQITEEQKKHPELMDVRMVTMKSAVPDEVTNPQNSPLEITISKSAKEIPLEVPAN
ncbi:MAG: hypothetical protein Q4G03_00445 [Planctomycetia bacterium]|nr:hypothetical protein [Planctomycetia bacterium]